jgi:undecaprenyl-diphosphatase
MLERLIDLVSQFGPWAYLVIGLTVSLESAAFLGFFMPGDTFVFLGGFMASQHALDLKVLLVLVPIAAIVGDSIGYELGRHFGRDWLLRHGHWIWITQHRLSQVDYFFNQFGGATVFFARFSVFFRILVPFVAGSVRLRYLRFLFYNVLGGVIWGIGAVLVGYLAGESWAAVEHWIGRVGAIIGGTVLLVILLIWLWRKGWPRDEA